MPSRARTAGRVSGLGQDHRLDEPSRPETDPDLRERSAEHDPRRAPRIWLRSVSAGQPAILALGAGLSARDISGLLLLGLVAVAVYFGLCRVWPYGPCVACRIGGGNRKRCKRCKRTGERLRTGTRIMRAWSGGKWPS